MAYTEWQSGSKSMRLVWGCAAQGALCKWAGSGDALREACSHCGGACCAHAVLRCSHPVDLLAATSSKAGGKLLCVSATQHGAGCGVQFVARSGEGGRGDESWMRGDDGDAKLCSSCRWPQHTGRATASAVLGGFVCCSVCVCESNTTTGTSMNALLRV